MISPMTQEKCDWAALVDECVERRKYVCSGEYFIQGHKYCRRIWSNVAVRE
jgi:hypothetical protein